MSEQTLVLVALNAAFILIGVFLGRWLPRRTKVMSEQADLTEGGKKPWFRRERRSEYDSAPLLIRAALVFVGILIIFVASIIGVQILNKGEANTESWAALTGLIGWATSQVSVIFSNRFGNTQQSAKKDEVIAQQATTAAVMANTTSVKPAVVPPEAPKTDAPETLKSDTVNIDAQTAVVTEKPKGDTPS